ncbi:MAG: hypothetical protein KBC21_00055 [Candidatus Pacebacteria bacterium]|nr:hypothetical protein [Candidatus Paceibacterota bacterium]
MRSRLYGVTKDVAIIFFFLVCFFVLTHNPMVRPEPKKALGTWSIELRQRPLALGIAGHNYLMLRNEQGEVVAQLHGLPTDTVTGAWKYIGRNKTDVLRVWEFDKENPNKELENGYGISLIATSQIEALRLWEKAQTCAIKVDLLYLPYPPFGISFRKDTENSNSVAYTLATCMGLATKHIGLFTPGWGKDLLENSR